MAAVPFRSTYLQMCLQALVEVRVGACINQILYVWHLGLPRGSGRDGSESGIRVVSVFNRTLHLPTADHSLSGS